MIWAYNAPEIRHLFLFQIAEAWHNSLGADEKVARNDRLEIHKSKTQRGLCEDLALLDFKLAELDVGLHISSQTCLGAHQLTAASL